MTPEAEMKHRDQWLCSQGDDCCGHRCKFASRVCPACVRPNGCIAARACQNESALKARSV